MTDGNTIRSVAKAMELLQLLSDAGEAMTQRLSIGPQQHVIGPDAHLRRAVAVAR